MNLTLITPVHPMHRDILSRCIASVKAQTVPCRHFVGIDNGLRGAGVIRNELLKRVETPYVSFLDADDWIESDFAEACLSAIEPQRYVYTDWYEGSRIQTAPDQAWCAGEWHLINAVLPTPIAQQAQFDPALPGLEDTDFWLHVMQLGLCGKRVSRPLVHYEFNPTGRSQQARQSGLEQEIKAQLRERYGGRPMACCGETVIQTAPIGARLDGDVLAMALWHGNRIEKGRVSQRTYPRISYPRTAWLDPRDIDAAPRMWKRMETATLYPEYESQNGGMQILDPAELLPSAGLVGKPAEVIAPPAQYTPDTARIIKTAKKKLK